MDNEWWYNFRAKTFDRAAVALGLTINPETGTEEFINGHKVYRASDFLNNLKKQRQIENKAMLERPIAYFFLIGIPNMAESFCRLFPTFLSYIYFLRHPKHIVDLQTRVGWHDTDWRMQRAIELLLIEYVEIECNGLDGEMFGLRTHLNSPERNKKEKRMIKKLIEAYEYFKYTLPKEKYPMMGENKEYEKHLLNVVKYRGYLWT